MYALLKPERASPHRDVIIAVCAFLTDFATRETLDREPGKTGNFKTTLQKESSPFRTSIKSNTARSAQLDLSKTFTKQENEKTALANIKLNGTKYLRAIAATDLPESLVHVLADSVMDPQLSAYIIQAISALSLYVPLAQKIGELGAMKDLVVVICNSENFRDPLVNICIDCIWNILEQDDTSDQVIIDTLAREELIISLRWTLSKIIKEGYKLGDKKLRNELFILICYIVQSPKTHQYFLSREENDENFLEEILRYSSHDELILTAAMASKSISSRSNKAMWGTDPEDLEFKRLLWTSVSRLISSSIPEALDIVINSDFIPAILVYLDPTQKTLSITRWQEPQLKEIQLHALDVIYHTLALIPEYFQQQNGNYCLVNFLTSHNDPDHKYLTLRALEVASQFSFFKVELAEEGLFDILHDIIQSDKDYSLNIRQLALSIISNTCTDCRSNQKEIRRKGWIELIKTNIKLLAPTVMGEPDQFMLGVIECLWNAILQNKRSMLHFIDTEGLGTLLDYLDECPEVHIRLIISCLCQLLKIPRAKNAFLHWNSHKTMSNASQLLIRIYEDEEKRLGVIYEQGGILKDPLRPLTYSESKGVKSFERLREALQAGVQSEIVLLRKKQLEFVRKRDLRASIYCVLSSVGFDSNEILPKEMQKMEVIRMYPDFRKGELLLDIKNELEAIGIKPIQDDKEYLDYCLREAYDQATNTIKNQSMIARESKKEEDKQLDEFYKSILKIKAN